MSDDTGVPTGLAATVADGPRPDESTDMPTLVDRFLIEDELGAGGMGRVYLAYDPSLDRKVAVKLLRHSVGVDQDKANARMAREARAMARLRHPNVVTIHEVGTPDGGGVFLVMEYAPGGTLRDWLERDPEPSWQQIVQMYTYAGRGLAAAHDAGLVHRDFKPDNVLVGDDGRVQVTDFGIANIHGEEPGSEPPSGPPSGPKLTRAGSVIGTPAYMSPEQHRGRAVDARSDQFAFCAALYEALYGVRPFAGETYTEISDHATRGAITPPARVRGEPPAIGEAIRRGLRPDPEQRFPSMQGLLEALALPAEPARSSRRARWLVAALALVTVGVAVVALTRGSPPATPVTPAAPVRPDGPIAIEPFELELTSYLGGTEWRVPIGDVVATLVGDVDGFKTIGPSKRLGGEAGATYVVRGKLEERAPRLRARIVIEHAGRVIGTIERERPLAELWPLLDDTARAIAGAISDGATLPAAGTNRARALQAIGEGHLRDNNFQIARPFFEQAVVADPRLFDAWYGLVLVRSWVLAPERQVFDALAAATAAAPTPGKRRLVEGIGAYLHHELPRARGVLEQLLADPALANQDRRDALYFLGEAHWHDGHHRAGTAFFQQALDIDIRFKPSIAHLTEYATANRDVAMLNQYGPMVATSTRDYRDTAEFVAGHYDVLARDPSSPLRLHAAIAKGDPLSAADEAELAARPDPSSSLYLAARALERGDRPAARREIDKVWAGIAPMSAGGLADNHYYTLRLLGDVLLAGGDADELERLLGFLAERSREHPVRSYQRLSILAAGLLGDRSLIVRRELTERDATLADAIEAELAGDRAKAAALLRQLVDDPSPFWEFPERVALLRNLVALRRTAEARALCADTLRPAIFMWAFLPARGACKRLR